MKYTIKDLAEGKCAVSRIEYFRDERTNLCFAKIENSYTEANNYSLSITCVPCDSIKHLIK